VRAVLWVQGCSRRCPGCFNPETHPFEGGEAVPVEALLQRIAALQDTIEGLTVSGGEPLEQEPAITALLRQVKTETGLSVLLFTGFSWEEIQQGIEALHYVDVLIAGRYDRTQPRARGLRGSANQTVHFLTDRYTLADLEAVPSSEVILTPEGEALVSGIRPVRRVVGG
jgi:anaerobic ribonucleoside-triphosphate reductase activating protein